MITPEFQIQSAALVEYLNQLRDHLFIARPTDDGDFRVISSNSAMLKFLGRPTEQVVGLTIRELIGGAAAERIIKTYSEVYNTGKHLLYEEDSGGTEYQFEVFETSLFRFTDPESGDYLIGGISRNISLRKSIQESLESSRHKLESKIRELEVLQRQLQEESMRDPLTGLLNRRHLDEFLNHELARSKRHQQPLSIMMIDLDNFKAYNDSSGHQAGDRLLRNLGYYFRSTRRSSDLLFRYGGDEFLFILPDTDVLQTKELAQFLKDGFQTQYQDYVLEDDGLQSEGAPITFSMGCASYPLHAENAFDIIRCADEALFTAKRRGRNRLAIFGQE